MTLYNNYSDVESRMSEIYRHEQVHEFNSAISHVQNTRRVTLSTINAAQVKGDQKL